MKRWFKYQVIHFNMITNFNDYLGEASDYEFDPAATAERLKRREQQNIKRYRAAQDRQDNFAIGLYELKIKMDKIDLEKLKVQTAIHELKKKYGRPLERE